VNPIRLERVSDEPEMFQMVVVNLLSGSLTRMLSEMNETQVRAYLRCDGFPDDVQDRVLAEARGHPVVQSAETFSRFV
jgi:hypothetical protein